MTSLSEALAEALNRVADFNALQCGRETDEQLAAISRLQESVDVDDDARVALREGLTRLPKGTENAGPILLGIIIGLTTGQLMAEADSRGTPALSD